MATKHLKGENKRKSEGTVIYRVICLNEDRIWLLTHGYDVETIMFASWMVQRSHCTCDIGDTLGTRVYKGWIGDFGVRKPIEWNWVWIFLIEEILESYASFRVHTLSTSISCFVNTPLLLCWKRRHCEESLIFSKGIPSKSYICFVWR